MSMMRQMIKGALLEQVPPRYFSEIICKLSKVKQPLKRAAVNSFGNIY